MPALMPWTTIEIGDVEVFLPTLPSLLVYTWYEDGEPESSVTYFWRDEESGALCHELLYVGPAAFDAAVSLAQEEAPKRSVERIHVKHARRAKKPAVRAQSKRAKAPAGGKVAAKRKTLKKPAAKTVKAARGSGR